MRILIILDNDSIPERLQNELRAKFNSATIDTTDSPLVAQHFAKRSPYDFTVATSRFGHCSFSPDGKHRISELDPKNLGRIIVMHNGRKAELLKKQPQLTTGVRVIDINRSRKPAQEVINYIKKTAKHYS